MEAAVERMEAVSNGILIEKRHKGVSAAAHVRHMAGHLEQHAKRARTALNRFKCSGEVVIEVRGGVAEITKKPEDIYVSIIDHDNSER
ncbi:MAG: hypothetical protein EB117_16120 [Betaproteobacteria bacterium]|nr:hypothetical protein [Betaproteobacteria bacterium]